MITDELPELKKKLEAAIDAHKLGKYRQEILALARPKIVVRGKPVASEEFAAWREANGKTLPPGNSMALLTLWEEWQRDSRVKFPMGVSRIGALPDLPAGVEWPTNKGGQKLHFAAQVDCRMLPAVPGLPLPRKGWLYFFAQNSDEDFPMPNRVLYFDGPVEALARPPLSVEAELVPSWLDHGIFDLVPLLDAAVHFDMPVWAKQAETEEEKKFLWEIFDDGENEAAFKELIKPVERMAITFFGVGCIDGETPTEMARGQGKQKEGDDWMRLVKLHRKDDFEWLGENGLWMFIRRRDLERGDFSNIYATHTGIEG